jgi:Relaxase/Mobilisation nuclease domain
VVIKGTSCAGAARIAKHLSCTETNEHNELHELKGVAADDLYGALREMEAVALGTRCQKPFCHASINTLAGERLTDEQRAHAIDRLEAALGLSGQPPIVVIHRKKATAREHCHIVWSRIDLERMRAISDSHNYRKHEQVARELEREFGHARVQGAHVERDGRPRPKRTPSHAEMRQAERSGLSVQAVTAAITDIWRRTDSGRAFARALQDAGYILARGDRRDFVVIDPKGGVHMARYLVHYLRIATQYTHAHPRGALGIAGGAMVGGAIVGALDTSGPLLGVAIIWGTLKAGYSAVVIASIIAAVRGSVKIITHVRQTGSTVTTGANATRQKMAAVSSWLTALSGNLANTWSARPRQENTPGYRLISAA